MTEKVELVARPPTEEIVQRDELVRLFETNSRPLHYIGLEISGFLHLGSLISTGFKINDLIKAGVNCTVFLADWHTVINDKLGGSWDDISRVSGYYADAFRLVCPGVNIVMGSDLYEKNRGYWADLVGLAKHMSLARTMRTLTIMGRGESEKIDLAKLLYPPMQAADIHFLDVDIAHAGMDQRKIHMLVRETFPKMGWKVPVAIHHKLLPGLTRPRADGQPAKMSKSDPGSGIFIDDEDDVIESKISRAWCEQGNAENNPLLEMAKHVIFHEYPHVDVERPDKFGGNVTYHSYDAMEADFAVGRLHPGDLKKTVSRYIIRIVAPVRKGLVMDEELRATMQNSGGV